MGAHPAPYAPAPPHHGYCDPKAPPKCAEGSDLPYCVVDEEYPAYDIANEISQDALFLKKYADIADQSADDLVEVITKPQEESFDYKYYSGASKGPSPYDATHWIGPEGYLCPSDVDYAKITRAVNVEGYWRIILQHIPEGYGYGHYKYTQKYVYHRMLSVDPCDPYRGFFIDTYKLPSACSCHIPQTISPPFPFPSCFPKTHPSPKIPQPTVTEENHGPHVVLVENLPFIYSYLFFAQKPKSVRASSSRRPPTELHNIWAAAWTER